MKDSKFKGTLSRCEVESLVNPLRDREPTRQWLQELKGSESFRCPKAEDVSADC